MRENFSTISVGGYDFPLPLVSSNWEFAIKSCKEVTRRYQLDPDFTVVHERCDDETCEICNRVFEETN